MMKKIVKTAASAILTIGLLLVPMPAAFADVAYMVSNYSTGSFGKITVNGGAYQVSPNLYVGLGGDAASNAFKDHNGSVRLIAREYHYGGVDSVKIFDPANLSAPIADRNDLATNIHAVASSGKYLYLATYESADDMQSSGEIVRVDMSSGYAPAGRYKYNKYNSPYGSGEITPHGEGVAVVGGKAYGLFAPGIGGYSDYEPAQVIEFDGNMAPVKTIELKNQARWGKNPSRMISHNGLLYVTCMGGYQGGADSWGDVWEIDPATGNAEQVLDTKNMPNFTGGNAFGIYGIQIAQDGTAFILAGGYDNSYNFSARLYATTAGRLRAGDCGTLIKGYADRAGFSWGILYDEPNATLWWMTGTDLDAWRKNGASWQCRTFTPGELGDDIYSVSLITWPALSTAGRPDPVPPSIGNGAPSDVEPAAATLAPDKANAAAAAGINENLLEIQPENTDKVVLKESVAKRKATEIASSFDAPIDGVTPLPVFTATVTQPGNTAAVGIPVLGAEFLVGKAENVNVIKVLRDPDAAPLKFAYVSNPGGYADGTFTIQTMGGQSVTDISLADNSMWYSLVLFIKDGGAYDLDGAADGKVIDPAVIVRAANPDVPLTPEDGGNSAGCDAGAGMAAVIILGFMMAVKRRAR